jgi:hypothetical protein
MFAQAKLARRPARVKPERALAARNPSGRAENKQTQVVRRGNLKRSVLNDSNRPVRTRMPGGGGGVGQVTWPPLSRLRPAWAHSCGCKSRRKLITANEVKRNCVRATERGKEAWSISCEPMNKNRIEGAAEQGERAMNREALVIKAKWRKSGGCAAKECVLTWGDLALCLKGRRC